MPSVVLTSTLVLEPLFEQLTELVKMCHVSVGQQGLCGSCTCLKVYEEDVLRTVEVLQDGNAAGVINAEKTEQMRNVVRNKVTLYIKQLHWLQSLLPTVIKTPEKATSENLRSFVLSQTERAMLTETRIEGADMVRWPSNHPIRTPSKARINTLRTLLGAMVRHVPAVVTITDIILNTTHFDRLLAKATQNVRKKYTKPFSCARVVCVTKIDQIGSPVMCSLW